MAGYIVIGGLPLIFPAEKRLISMEKLTDREREVLLLAARGLTNKEIAAKIGSSIHTIKTQQTAIRSKLGALNTTHAVALALKANLISLEE